MACYWLQLHSPNIQHGSIWIAVCAGTKVIKIMELNVSSQTPIKTPVINTVVQMTDVWKDCWYWGSRAMHSICRAHSAGTGIPSSTSTHWPMQPSTARSSLCQFQMNTWVLPTTEPHSNLPGMTEIWEHGFFWSFQCNIADLFCQISPVGTWERLMKPV